MTKRETQAQERLEQWKQILQKRKLSGKTVEKFCQDEGLSYHTYRYYQSRIYKETSSTREAREKSATIGSPKDTAVSSNETPPVGWVICKETKATTEDIPVYIEIGKCRIVVTSAAKPELLTKACCVVMTIC